MKIGDYNVLQEREDSTMASMWECSLCLERTEDGLRLVVKSHEVLGFADDLCKLDENYERILPQTVGGKRVLDVEDDVLVGEELVDNDQYDALDLPFADGFDASDVRLWLRENGWKPELVFKIGRIWRQEKAAV
jgi:hypothetical protein